MLRRFRKSWPRLQLPEGHHPVRPAISRSKIHRPVRNRKTLSAPQWLNQTHKQHAADPHQRLQRQPFPVLSDQISVDFSSKQLSFASHPETSTRYPPVSLSFIVLECISLSSPFFALMISRHESQQGHCSSRAKGRIRKMFSREDLASREGLYKSQNCAAREFCARLKHARAAPAV
jgi:hypothetical protein